MAKLHVASIFCVFLRMNKLRANGMGGFHVRNYSFRMSEPHPSGHEGKIISHEPFTNPAPQDDQGRPHACPLRRRLYRASIDELF